MSYYVAPSLVQLKREADLHAPDRSHQADGFVGDERHARTESDHNPKPDGLGGMVVDAYDMTHDPEGGMDAHTFAGKVIARRDRRIKYVISNGWITSSYPTGDAPAWVPRPYTGTNPHTHHAHFSVAPTEAARRSTDSWGLGDPITPPEVSTMFEGHRFVPVPGSTSRQFYSWDPTDSSLYAWNGAPGPIPSAEGQKKIRAAGGIRHLSLDPVDGLLAVVGDPGAGAKWGVWAFKDLGPGDRIG